MALKLTDFFTGGSFGCNGVGCNLCSVCVGIMGWLRAICEAPGEDEL